MLVPLDFEVGARGDLASTGDQKRSCIRSFELTNTFRQVPCYSAGATFLVQGFILCPLRKSGRARIALVRFTLLHDASRWTLYFPSFYVVPRAFQNLTV